MADLLTLAELKIALGETTTDNDQKYQMMITAASSMVRTYTGRDFNASPTTETRTFEYDGSGYLDIDDAQTVTSIALVVPGGSNYTYTTDQYVLQPPRREDSTVYTFVIMPRMASLGYDPAMGFNRNMDVYVRDHGVASIPQTVQVAGVWGWTVVPDDVKWATVWIIEDWNSRNEGEALTAEAIAGYSRAWGRGQSVTAPGQAIPDRARDALSAYQRLLV